MIDERVAATQEISDTLAAGKAVVALESTVIAQGLPWPDNIATARAIEAAVRDMGAVPATIAILDGVIRIGLADSELVQIAASSLHHSEFTAGTQVPQVEAPAPVALAKANRRDLAAIVASAHLPRQRYRRRSGSPGSLASSPWSWQPVAWGACTATRR